MNNKLNDVIYALKKDVGLILSISFGVFLFILFFQPFPLDKFDFNNRVLLVAGLGVIVFLFIVLFRNVLPWLIQKNHSQPIFLSHISGFLVFASSAIAFVFYLRYVGSVKISFYIIIKIAFICLIPPVVLRLYDLFNDLKQENEALIKEKETIKNQIEKYKEDSSDKYIILSSENSTYQLKLLISEVMLIKAADNYVETVYKQGKNLKKELIRNTLKKIGNQLTPYSNFIRCHRTYIVNTQYIEKLNRKYNNYWLTLKEYTEQIPVSRQYLLRVKEAL